MIKRTLQKGEKLYVKTLNNAWIPVTFDREELVPCLVVKTQVGDTMTVQRTQVVTEAEFRDRQASNRRQTNFFKSGRKTEL